MLTRDAILAQMRRRVVTEHSEVFGGDLRVQELLRSEYRAADARADMRAQGDSTRLQDLRIAVRQWAVAHIGELSQDAQTALARALGAGQREINVDVFNASIFAAAVVDDTGVPLFSADDVLTWPERSAVWDEVLRIASRALDLSEVGSNALKEPSPDSPATTDATPSTAAT